MTSNQFLASAIPQLLLIVDAHEDTRELYKMFLIPRRYIVATAADGIEALTKARADVPDIIVTETLLPGMDGYTLCERLRADPRTAAVPIVVLTAETRPLRLERARRAGADSVLVKPCLPERLLTEMQALRELSRALRARAEEVRRVAHARTEKSVDLLARASVLTAKRP